MALMISSFRRLQFVLALVAMASASPTLLLAQSGQPTPKLADAPTYKSPTTPTPPESFYAIKAPSADETKPAAAADTKPAEPTLTINYRTKKREGLPGFDVVDGECVERELVIQWTDKSPAPDHIFVSIEMTFEGAVVSKDPAAPDKAAPKGATGKIAFADCIDASKSTYTIKHEQLNEFAKSLVKIVDGIEDGFNAKNPIPSPTTVNVWITPNQTTTAKLKTANVLTIKFQQVFP